MDLLHTFLEISIAILAFISIVAQFGRSSSKTWNFHQYQGIIGHSFQAFIYASLPLLILEFGFETANVWTFCTLVMGTLTFGQGILVWFVDKITEVSLKLLLIIITTFVFLLQLTYVAGYVDNPIAVYNGGIFIHIFQSMVLVIRFIYNPQD